MFRRKKKKPEIRVVGFTHDYRALERSSPEFYAYSEHEKVAELTNGMSTLAVFCDGEMHYEMADGEIRRVSSDDLLEAGLTTDFHIEKAHEQGLFAKHPWFDLYGKLPDGRFMWLDEVAEDLDQALEKAKMVLSGDGMYTDYRPKEKVVP
jgi:hypothetical protein